MATTGLLSDSLLEYLSPSLCRKGFTTCSINTTYTTAKASVYKALNTDPAFTIAITAARIHQAVISSAAAQVMAMVPRRVLDRPRSCTMRASTGKAVMLMAIPIKSAKERKWMPSGAKRRYIK